jgi:nucleoside-diphosphate-sugar epimerase
MAERQHVIFGTGPVGIWTARALRDMGHAIRAVNRTGQRPGLLPSDVEVLAADASDPRQALQAASGAAVIYQALNPPYDTWHERFPPLQRPVMMRLAGLFVPAARESVEMLYQFTEPWVISSNAIESAFGLKPTPITEGLKRTIEWWKREEAGTKK